MFKENLEVILEMFTSSMGLLVETSSKFKWLDPLFGNKYGKMLEKNEEILVYLRKVCVG